MNTHSNTHNTYNNQPNVLDKAAAALPGHQTNAGSAGNVAPEAHHSHAGVGTGFDNTHSGIGSHSNQHSALGSNTHSTGLGSNNHSSGLGSNTHSHSTHGNQPNALDKVAAALPGHQTNAGSAGNVAPSSDTGHSLGHDSHSHTTGTTGTHLAGDNTHGLGPSHAPPTNVGSHLHTHTGSHLPPTTGTHTTGSHTTGAHHGASPHSTKPSVGDKISGKIEEVVGKITKDPVKVQEGVLKQEVGKEGLNHGAGAGVGGAGRY